MSRVGEGSGLFLVSLQAASPFVLGHLHGICSSLRVAGDSELSASTRNYRWLAVLLGSDAETSSTKPVSLGGQKASYSHAADASSGIDASS